LKLAQTTARSSVWIWVVQPNNINIVSWARLNGLVGASLLVVSWMLWLDRIGWNGIELTSYILKNGCYLWTTDTRHDNDRHIGAHNNLRKLKLLNQHTFNLKCGATEDVIPFYSMHVFGCVAVNVFSRPYTIPPWICRSNKSKLLRQRENHYGFDEHAAGPNMGY